MTVARGSGRRDTVQRRAVLEVLRDAADHPTAAEIHARVSSLVPGIGAATVYRALHRLVAGDLARELRLGDEAVIRYDGNTGTHDHLVCESCGTVVDVSPRVPVRPPSTLAADTGFRITGHELRLLGRCSTCITASTTHPA